MSARLPGISVVLPAWNEEGNVARAVSAARAAAEKHAEKVEVVVVDDGSADGTAEEARRAGAEVVAHGRNRGYGAALRTGFDSALMPWIFLVDADNQFDPDQLADLVAVCAEADMVVGHRIQRADGISRLAGGWAWNGLCRALFGYLGHDIDCAFKLVRTDLVRSLDLRSDGAPVSTELFVEARRQGARIVEIPVRHFPRTTGEPSGLHPRVVARALVELWRLRRRVGPKSRWRPASGW